MDRLIRLGLINIWIAILLSACGGGSAPGSNLSESSSSRVYIAGEYFDGLNLRACYWMDNNTTPATVGAPGQDSVSYALAVSSGHVYTAGYYHDGLYDRACY